MIQTVTPILTIINIKTTQTTTATIVSSLPSFDMTLCNGSTGELFSELDIILVGAFVIDADNSVKLAGSKTIRRQP